MTRVRSNSRPLSFLGLQLNFCFCLGWESNSGPLTFLGFGLGLFLGLELGLGLELEFKKIFCGTKF